MACRDYLARNQKPMNLIAVDVWAHQLLLTVTHILSADPLAPFLTLRIYEAIGNGQIRRIIRGVGFDDLPE